MKKKKPHKIEPEWQDADEPTVDPLDNFEAIYGKIKGTPKKDIQTIETNDASNLPYKMRRIPSKKNPVIEIDLHGLTLEDAKSHVERCLNYLVEYQKHVTVRVITGRGITTRSGRGTLAEAIHPFIVQRFTNYISRIEASPVDHLVGGLPFKGFFELTLKS